MRDTTVQDSLEKHFEKSEESVFCNYWFRIKVSVKPESDGLKHKGYFGVYKMTRCEADLNLRKISKWFVKKIINGKNQNKSFQILVNFKTLLPYNDMLFDSYRMRRNNFSPSLTNPVFSKFLEVRRWLSFREGIWEVWGTQGMTRKMETGKIIIILKQIFLETKKAFLKHKNMQPKLINFKWKECYFWFKVF